MNSCRRSSLNSRPSPKVSSCDDVTARCATRGMLRSELLRGRDGWSYLALNLTVRCSLRFQSLSESCDEG